jgi:hypothetical protein
MLDFATLSHMWNLAQKPIVVDLTTKTEPSRDISIEVVLAMFAVAGIFLLVAVVGCALVAGGMLFYKRWRDASGRAADAEPTHIRLQI